MNRLLELCLPRLLTYEQYIQRLDSVPSSSKDIQTLEEAKQYWQKHFNGKDKPITVNYKRQQTHLFVTFSTNHGFTGKNSAWTEGTSNDKRTLELDRAQHMDDIWKVLESPDVITWSHSTPTNKQYDKVLEAQDRIYGRVILVPTPTPQDVKNGECTHFEFASFHLPNETQFKAAKNSRSQTMPNKIKGR